MSILIKDMALPSEPTDITFYPDGWWKDYVDGSSGKWVEFPSHGRLIDADYMKTKIEGPIEKIRLIHEWIDTQPTILEAEGESNGKH